MSVLPTTTDRCGPGAAGRGHTALDTGHECLVGRLAIAGALEVLGEVGVQPLQRPQQVLLAEAHGGPEERRVVVQD